MSTTYDGSTPSSTDSGDDPYAGLPPAPTSQQPPTGPPVAHSFVPDPEPGGYDPAAASTHHGHNNGGSDMSGLAMLRQRVAAHQEQVGDDLWYREIPGIGVRLVCNPEIENTTFQRWVKAARPKAKRRQGQAADPSDSDQLVLASKALAETSIAVEVNHTHGTGREPDWRPLLSDHDGEPLNLLSDELKRGYGVLTELALLQAIYKPKADPRIIDAGMDLLSTAGYMGELDDDPEA